MRPRNKSVADPFPLTPFWGRRCVRWRLIACLLPVLAGSAGCGAHIPVYEVSFETVETARPDPPIVGNRGYIVGTPPETHGAFKSPPPVKQAARFRIRRKETVRFEPWKAIMALDRWMREHMW